MIINRSLKLSFWTALLVAGVGLSACQKKEETKATPEEEEVVMSAEPATNEEPTIVASDLDEVDAQLEEEVDPDAAEIDMEEAISEPDTPLENADTKRDKE